MNAALQVARAHARLSRPRLGFLGVGWIGRQRMQVLAESGTGEVAAIADPCDEACAAAMAALPGVQRMDSLEALLEQELDGIVIATPSAAHAAQAIAALQRGVAVFCQKPLTRTAAEAERVVAAARAADRLLDVDFSYRHVAGVPAMRALLRQGCLGEVHTVDLTFHNAYGPDKPWFRDAALSGGGCVMDLGIHLLDLALWLTGERAISDVQAQLRAGGRLLAPPVDTVEDYAAVQARLGNATLRLACSWNLPAGCDAVIEVACYGSAGGVALRNVDGSFYDFTVDRFQGTRRERLAAPPDAWGGRALVRWAGQLARDPRFDPACGQAVDVARAVDAIYGR